MKECENCTEWEYFEGYDYGCFCMKTMSSIAASECEYYHDKRKLRQIIRDSDGNVTIDYR